MAGKQRVTEEAQASGRYTLTSESFTVTDGPKAGRSFARGQTYDAAEIPPGELARFIAVVSDQPGLPGKPGSEPHLPEAGMAPQLSDEGGRQ